MGASSPWTCHTASPCTLSLLFRVCGCSGCGTAGCVVGVVLLGFNLVCMCSGCGTAGCACVVGVVLLGFNLLKARGATHTDEKAAGVLCGIEEL